MAKARRGSEKRQLTKAVLVRLEPEAHAALVRLAEREGETVAGALRRLAEAATNGSSGMPRRARPATTAPLAGLGEVASRTAILTGLMTQIAAYLRTSGAAPWHGKAEAAVRDLRAMAALLQQIIEAARR